MPYTWIDVAPAIELILSMKLDSANRVSSVPRDVVDIVTRYLGTHTQIDTIYAHVMYQSWGPTEYGTRHVMKNDCLVYACGYVNGVIKERMGDAITEEDREYADRIRRHHG